MARERCGALFDEARTPSRIIVADAGDDARRLPIEQSREDLPMLGGEQRWLADRKLRRAGKAARQLRADLLQPPASTISSSRPILRLSASTLAA